MNNAGMMRANVFGVDRSQLSKIAELSFLYRHIKVKIYAHSNEGIAHAADHSNPAHWLALKLTVLMKLKRSTARKHVRFERPF